MVFFKNLRKIKGIPAIVVFSFLGLTTLLSGCGSCGGSSTAKQTEITAQNALDEYIQNNDSSFGWEIESNTTDDNGTGYVVNMVSQTWQNIAWKHKMYIIEPAKLTNPEHCALYITGGAIGDKPRESDMQLAQHVARLSGMYVAVLWQVPNQPLFDGRNEDDLITDTFLKMLETKDFTWPLLFPMTKSAIRSMDAIQQLLRQHRSKNIKGFVVFGASKRGWTTWLTAASQDKRVIAIAPMVINTLNMQPQYIYQLANWGYYSEQIADYYSKNLLVEQVDPNASEEEKKLRDQLWQMVDPYFYRERVTIPKLLIHGTNDRYWNLDATKFYWNDLVGPKFILNLPNVGHNLGDERTKALTTIAAYAKLISDGGYLPTMTWKAEYMTDEYTLSVTSTIPAHAAKLWIAYNETRDFREAKWNPTDLQPLTNGNGNYLATLKKPESGHIGFYIELETEYEGIPCSLTTEIFNP